MLSFLTNSNLLLAGVLLAVLQGIAALPWLRAIDPKGFDKQLKSATGLGYAVLAFVGSGIVVAGVIAYTGESANQRLYGRIYGSVLHLQLLIDFFILAPVLLVALLPKTGAVAFAAFRESCRQPMFWLIAGFTLLAMILSVWFPYFTFGDDYKMMKSIGFDLVMLMSALFGILASSISISEEIEGRTAITVMSKPINRRQFLVGKFLGIFLACMAMSLTLAWFLNWALHVQPQYDKINDETDPMVMQADAYLVPKMMSLFADPTAKVFVEGAGAWASETVAHSFGVALGFGQVMILVAIATALATRLPFIVNIVVILVVYFLGNLAPLVVKVTNRNSSDGSVGLGLVRFLGQLFDTILPALEHFSMGQAVVRETPLDLWQFGLFVLTVLGYSVIYTGIALVVGLLLFENRDLA